MKKLMIAAACAAMVGAGFASCEDPEDPVVANCASVYNVSVTVKTLSAKSKTTTTKVECAEDVTETSCYMVSGTRKYAGIIASCECVCSDTEAVEDGKFYFWSTSEKKAICDADIEFGNVIRFGTYTSSTAKKVANTFKIESADYSIALAGAGFGTVDYKNRRFLSLSGYVAGTVSAPQCAAQCEEGTVAFGFNLCDDEKPDATCVPAYGTWSFKYNSSASKKYMNDSTYVESTLLPSYYASACLN